MCLCGENGAAKETEVGFLVLVVQTVALFAKNLRGSNNGFFLIEFNAQHAALVLPVMDDADIFDADVFHGQFESSISGALDCFFVYNFCLSDLCGIYGLYIAGASDRTWN